MTQPRRRGRPKKPKGVSIEVIHDPAPELDASSWGAQSRLEVLQEVLNTLQEQWADKGMPARDRTPMSRAIGQAAEQVQAEKHRLAALNPDPILPVDQAALVAEIVAGVETLPRKTQDALAAALDRSRRGK